MIQTCAQCKTPICISKIDLFRNLTLQQQAMVVSFVKRKAFKKGDVFLCESQSLSQFVIVNSGKFKAYTNGIDGKQKVLYHFSVGDFFGQHALFKVVNIPYTIEAMESSSICMIESETMHKLIKQEPELAIAIVSALSSRVAYLENELSSAHQEKIETRLLRLLYDLSKDYGRHTSHEVILQLPLNQEEIAMRLGVTRESISRNLRKLVNQQIIKMPTSKEIILPKM